MPERITTAATVGGGSLAAAPGIIDTFTPVCAAPDLAVNLKHVAIIEANGVVVDFSDFAMLLGLISVAFGVYRTIVKGNKN